MGYISNGQSFMAGASGVIGTSVQQDAFQTSIDAVLVGLGRDITLHLPPAKAPCTSADCKFNSFYKRWVTTTGQPCESCRGNGFILEPRYTSYRANIRWTNEPYNQGNSQQEADYQQFGRVGVDFCRTKMVVAAYDHIKESVGATIDGTNVELFDEPRKTGFGNRLMYTVAMWKVANR
jgi:hypothetical protein